MRKLLLSQSKQNASDSVAGPDRHQRSAVNRRAAAHKFRHASRSESRDAFPLMFVTNHALGESGYEEKGFDA